MNCKECGKPMILDDRDFNFKGCYDNYWNCENCQTSCIEQVRFGESFKEIWHSENVLVKDCTIKCKPVPKIVTSSVYGRMGEGRWKGAGMGDYTCSVCGDTFSGGNRFRFCPGCGHPMEVRDNG